MHSALDMCLAFSIPKTMWELFKVSFSVCPNISSLAFQFVYYLPQILLMDLSIFENTPQVVASNLEKFQVRKNKGKPFELILQKAKI